MNISFLDCLPIEVSERASGIFIALRIILDPREFPSVGVSAFPLWMSAKGALIPKLLEAILLVGAIMAGQGVKASAEMLKNAVIANPTAKHTATVS